MTDHRESETERHEAPAAPSPDEVAHLLRLVDFTMQRAETAIVAFVDRRHIEAIERDHQRLGDAREMVADMLKRLPPEPPSTPEREAAAAGFIAATLEKRFGDGTDEDIAEAFAAFHEAFVDDSAGGEV